jgi:glucose-6-phosphate dehydrogenase assembly protein OpcA
MEDAVSSPATQQPPGDAVTFSNIAAAMARGACTDAGAMRALVATVVAIGPEDRLVSAADTLQALGDAGTVRGILISEGDNPAPAAHVSGNTVALYGLKSPYVNNAVAALRLSSLPTFVWWRGGRPDTIDGVADLADRIVLDEEQPETVWRRAIALFEDTAFSDIRWAKLTQWRALMAHFFDIPEVRAAAPMFTTLTISCADVLSARLFASWLTSTMKFAQGFTVDVRDAHGGVPIEEIQLGDRDQELRIRLSGRRCLETAVSVKGHSSATRIVSATDQTPERVLTEELRIRTRDLAFERALRALLGT